jgi:hypothetical protein
LASLLLESFALAAFGARLASGTDEQELAIFLTY